MRKDNQINGNRIDKQVVPRPWNFSELYQFFQTARRAEAEEGSGVKRRERERESNKGMKGSYGLRPEKEEGKGGGRERVYRRGGGEGG